VIGTTRPCELSWQLRKLPQFEQSKKPFKPNTSSDNWCELYAPDYRAKENRTGSCFLICILASNASDTIMKQWMNFVVFCWKLKISPWN